MVDLQGKTLGRYELRQLIGHGGMADVYLGYDTHFERDVAVKIFKRQDEEMLRRFIREARLMASLHNSHLTPVYDTGEGKIDGVTQYYIVMPVMAGGTLRARVRRAPLTLTEACRYLSDIADALDYIHSQGIIHRDIKSSNVLLDDEGNCYVSDFGIARSTNDVTQLTSTGDVLGTVDYVAPELFEPHYKADALSDLYSLGILLFEMVTGKLPFRGDTQIAVVAMHVSKRPPLPRTFVPDIPGGVERVMLRALEKNPAQRYQSATELAQAFCQAVKSPHIQPLGETISSPVWGEADATARTVREAPQVLPPAPVALQMPQSSNAPISDGSHLYPSQMYLPSATRRSPGTPAQKRGRVVAIMALVALLAVVGPVAYVIATHPPGNATIPAATATTAATSAPTPDLTSTAQVNGATATAQAASKATTTAQAAATATVQSAKNATATAIVAPTATVQAQVTATAGVIQTVTAGAATYTDPLTNADNAATLKAKWGVGPASCVFKADGYHVLLKTPAPSLLNGCIETGYTYTNFASSVDVTMISGQSGGLFFRTNNQAVGGAYAGYLFEIDANGNYRVSRSNNFSLGATALQDWTLSAVLKTGNGVKNTLQVWANGNTLDFYANNQFLKEIQDATFLSGNVAFVATSAVGGGDADMAYTNLQIFPK